MDEGRVYWRPVTDTGKILAVIGAGFALFALARALKRHRDCQAACRCEREDS